jgi:hypothetical protein
MTHAFDRQSVDSDFESLLVHRPAGHLLARIFDRWRIDYSPLELVEFVWPSRFEVVAGAGHYLAEASQAAVTNPEQTSQDGSSQPAVVPVAMAATA